MARKIFVSYKHSDTDVFPLLPEGGLLGTTARTYVNRLESLFADTHIYKGERKDESLAGFQDEYIESQLRDQIFDSSVTIVLISKNMKDSSKNEDAQWIPWEISYSLKEMTRNDRTSLTNAVLAVVLPDRNGSYTYFVESIGCSRCNSLRWKQENLFSILGKNMFNRKEHKTAVCPTGVCGTVHTGDDHSYIYPVKWSDFIASSEAYINRAVSISESIDDYELTKQII